MCDIVFENKECHDGTVNRMSVYAGAGVFMFIVRDFSEIARKHLCRNLFFDKVKLRCRCFLVNFSKFVRTPFLKDTIGLLLLIIAVPV